VRAPLLCISLLHPQKKRLTFFRIKTVWTKAFSIYPFTRSLGILGCLHSALVHKSPINRCIDHDHQL
jgi:hypothetical protein